MIEVEYRAFLDDNTYLKLEKDLNMYFNFIGLEKQITYYLNHEIDTRIQLSNNSARIWQKLGKLHDISRYEIDIPLQREDGAKMLQLFEHLGYSVKVAWFRERKSFKTKNISIELDNTIGYGRILEVEILCEENEIETSKEEILNLFKRLKLKISTKEEFDKAYLKYKDNWQVLTLGLSEHWLNE
jgi:predicted adenylyl cyclase CyaB